MLGDSVMSPAWTAGLLIVATIAIWGFHPLARWRYRSFRGPQPLWLLGNLVDFVRKGTHKVFLDWNAKYGSIYMFMMGPNPVVVVNEPEVGRALLLSSDQRMNFRGAAELLSGDDKAMQANNLAGLNDKERHRDLKNAWLPMFNSASLGMSTELINRSAEHLCTNLAGYARQGKETNVWRDFGRMTMDVVGSVAFGVDFHTQENDGSKNSEEAQRLVEASAQIFSENPIARVGWGGLVTLFPFLTPIVRPISQRFPDPAAYRTSQARKKLRSVVGQLMKDARSAQAAEGKVAPLKVDVDVSAGQQAAEPAAPRQRKALAPGSFLKHMLGSKHIASDQHFSDIEITAQAFIFLLAGYETTANTLAFTTYCLATNPEKAAKLMQEIDREAGQGEISLEQLRGMPYTEACVKEALRLFPPVTALARQAQQDTVILGHHVPKGAGIMVPVLAFHHSPEIYRNPEAYVPERWMEGTPEYAQDSQVQGKWMPFGDGTRVCVGQRLALMEAKVALAHVFRRFSFKLSPGQVPLDVVCPLLMKPTTGVFVTPMLRNEE
ncbi:hypothetical protein CVIRNUC_006642 [Coccomyxa viridis]|uniref:Cytochrome P450 n=1 Tax=Coccomyxa viridis TaxID=1274662 RepID=A0AAV1I8C9_9CHLO|nr:hypothetical protein CVIRNUC_006642 [Coccomyxa viridis]